MSSAFLSKVGFVLRMVPPTLHLISSTVYQCAAHQHHKPVPTTPLGCASFSLPFYQPALVTYA